MSEKINATIDKGMVQKLIEGDPNGLGAHLSQKFGDFVLEKTGSPIAAAGAKTIADLAPMFIAGMSGHGPGVVAGVEDAGATRNLVPALDMSHGARMERAASQGYDLEMPLYHSSDAKFTNFRPSEKGRYGPGIYTFEGDGPTHGYGENSYHLVAKKGKVFDATDIESPDKVEAIKNTLQELNLPTNFEAMQRLEKGAKTGNFKYINEDGHSILNRALTQKFGDQVGHSTSEPFTNKFLSDNGYVGLRGNLNGDNVRVIFNPSDIREFRGAAFDPDASDPTNMFSAKAGVAPSQQQDQNQDFAGGGVVEPPGLDQFLSQPQQTQNVPQGTIAPEPAGLDQFISEQQNEKVHGTPLEQAKAAVEGVARGATLGLSDLAETKLGISTPENVLGREAANPVTSAASQIGGGAALIGLTGGIAAPIEEGLGGGMAATAAGYGAEGAGFGMGNVISDRALGDPDLNAQKISTEVGMSALLGVGAGLAGRGLKSLLGKHGYIKGSPSDVVSDAASEANSDAETANTIQDKSKFKSNAPEIIQAAQDLGAPLSEGMVSADPWIQKAEDALVNGAPTYAGIKRAKLYEQGYEAAKKALTTVVGEPEAEGGMSKAQLGKALEQSLASRIDEENQPISALYNEVKSETSLIPLSERSLPRITQNIMDLDPVRLDPDGPAGQLARRMSKNIENIKTVDDAKALRKVLSDSLSKTASDGERYIMGEIADRVKALEENTITKHTENLIASILEGAPKDPAQLSEYEQIWGPKVERLSGLLEQKKQADALYRPFIGKIKTLAQMLGKKSVSGAQGAINFISTDLSPEQLASRAFQKGNSEMAEFFAKSFPNEWELVKQYQKGVLRDSSVMDRTGQFSSRAFIKKVDGLEPEIQKLLFSPDELKKINAAKTYLRSIPESFNPSGTSHMSAFREFFTHPTGAAISNARDFGIDAYIKAMGKVPDSIRPNPIETGSALAEKFNKLNSVRNVVDRVDSNISKGAKAIFQSGAGRGLVLEGASVGVHSYEDRTHRIQELASNFNTLGNHLSNSVEGLQSQLPNISQSMQNHMSASVLFLQSKIPRPNAQFMLSPEWKPSEMQKQKFNRYYESVANPVGVLQQIKTGKLTGEAVEAIQATHPDMFQEMRTKVLGEIDSEKAKALPYSVKLCLAKFLGQPLDASMLPQVIISNQLALNQPSSPNGMSPKQQRSNQAGLAKLKVASRATTDTQDLEEEKA